MEISIHVAERFDFTIVVNSVELREVKTRFWSQHVQGVGRYDPYGREHFVVGARFAFFLKRRIVDTVGVDYCVVFSNYPRLGRSLLPVGLYGPALRLNPGTIGINHRETYTQIQYNGSLAMSIIRRGLENMASP